MSEPTTTTHASGPRAGQPVRDEQVPEWERNYLLRQADDAARRREWAAALRWAAGSRKLDELTRAAHHATADQIEACRLTPWADQPVTPAQPARDTPAATTPADVQELRDELEDLSGLATRLAAAVEFVAGLDRSLTTGGGTNERAALRTLAADAHRAGLLPATGTCDCESYEPCYGACCGLGGCSCSWPQADLASSADQPEPAELCEATVYDRQGEPEPCGRQRPCCVAHEAERAAPPAQPDIPTRLGQVGEGLCREPLPLDDPEYRDGPREMCARERPCPEHDQHAELNRCSSCGTCTEHDSCAGAGDHTEPGDCDNCGACTECAVECDAVDAQPAGDATAATGPHPPPGDQLCADPDCGCCYPGGMEEAQPTGQEVIRYAASVAGIIPAAHRAVAQAVMHGMLQDGWRRPAATAPHPDTPGRSVGILGRALLGHFGVPVLVEDERGNWGSGFVRPVPRAEAVEMFAAREVLLVDPAAGRVLDAAGGLAAAARANVRQPILGTLNRAQRLQDAEGAVCAAWDALVGDQPAEAAPDAAATLGATGSTPAAEPAPEPDSGTAWDEPGPFPPNPAPQEPDSVGEPQPGTYWEASVLRRFATGGEVDMDTVRQQVGALLADRDTLMAASDWNGAAVTANQQLLRLAELDRDAARAEVDRLKAVNRELGVEARRQQTVADRLRDQLGAMTTERQQWMGRHAATHAEVERLRGEHQRFAAELGFGDGVSEAAASLADMIYPIREAMSAAEDHAECPVLCERCGETLAATVCQRCSGLGDVGSGAYSECPECAGVGRIHEGCVEASYADLVATVDRLRGELATAENDREAGRDAAADALEAVGHTLSEAGGARCGALALEWSAEIRAGTRPVPGVVTRPVPGSPEPAEGGGDDGALS